MYIHNAFSQTPTRNFTAAGIDFFVPNIDDDDIEQSTKAIEAFKKSYKLSDEAIEQFYEKVDEFASNELLKKLKGNYTNLVLLYCGLNDKERYFMRRDKTKTEDDCIKYFLDNVLTFDSNGRPGVICKFSDMLFINSGIKLALKPHTSFEFKNKSGKGSQGWSVKACLVDEDYSGFVHLSLQYLWWDDKFGTIYVGDKLTQGTVQQVETDDAVELYDYEYDDIMATSKRSDSGFGSSDVKH